MFKSLVNTESRNILLFVTGLILGFVFIKLSIFLVMLIGGLFILLILLEYNKDSDEQEDNAGRAISLEWLEDIDIKKFSKIKSLVRNLSFIVGFIIGVILEHFIL